MMNLFGSGKTVPEAYNETTMKPLVPENKIVVSFDELAGNYKGKYKITAGKGGKTAEYVVDPNAPSVNKAVVEAIVSKLNGGEEKVAVPPVPPGPTAPTGPTGPSEELQALNAEVDALIAGISDVEAINTATGKISAAIGAIPEAEKPEAIKKINDAITAVDAALTSEPAEPVAPELKTALDAAKSALEKAKEALVPATTGGYNSAKSAVPKRITRMRRTRRSAKLAGTRRRRRLTH